MGKKIYSYDKILCKKFGQKVVFLRKSKNITQAELAFQAGISPSYLSAIERGITDTSITTAKRLAKVLKIDLPLLFIFK